MQSKSNQNLRFALFMVLSGLILAGYVAFESWQQSKLQKLVDSRPFLDLYVRAPSSAVVPAVPGFGGALQQFANVQIADWLSKQRYRLPEAPPNAAVVKHEPEPEPKPKPKPRVQEPPQLVELGDEKNSNLHVWLTSRGGAVVSVTLNQFQAADANGRPEDVPLELVPKDENLGNPSNLLLHYENAEDDRPVDTLAELNWQIVSQNKGDKHDEVIFSAEIPGLPLRIIKTYTLSAKDYHVGLKIKIERTDGSTTPLKFRYQLTSGHGLPIEGVWYTYTYRNAMVGSLGKGKNFWRDFQDSRTIGIQEGGNRVLKGDSERIAYGGIVNQYFGAIVAVTDKIVFDDPTEPAQRQDFLAWARPTVESEPNPRKPFLDDITMRLVTEALDVSAGPLTQNYLLYYGPVKVMLLDSVASKGKSVPPEVVDRYINQLHLNTLTDSPSPGAMGAFSSAIYWTNLLIYFTNIMHGVLGYLHAVIPNYGICIIVLTVCVRALMHPISRKQARTSMKMQAIVPEIKKLQEKHKNDRQALAVAQMDLYRKHGVHPMGSCWIVFLQMPIFMGLYYSLQESIFLRLAPFLWIKNLAAPDMLIYWGENIPWISRPEDQGGFLYLGPYFNLLPIIAVSLMLVQQKYLMPPPTDEQQEMQQKMMKYMMIFMGLMFYKMAAGLCVYFIVSTLWGLTERKLLPKAKPQGAGTLPAPSAGPNRNGSARPKPRGSKDQAPDGMLKKVQDIWNEILEQAKKK